MNKPLEIEKWKVIEDFPSYEVSDQGRVRNKKTKHVRAFSNNHGYLQVDLYPGQKTKTVHRLVADAFLGKHPGMQVNHIDGNKSNNHVSNLEWCSSSENNQHAYNANLRNPPKEKQVRIIETGETFRSITKCAEAIGGNIQNVSACLNKKRASCNGLHFEYAKQDEKISPPFLYPHQHQAIDKMFTGCILNGGVGSGKSRTGLFYYFKENGGWIENGKYTPMKNPKDLYIITTAMKRDKLEWEGELANFLISKTPGEGSYRNKVVIDSWNNIKKYKDIMNAFFIFDEDRLTGSGVWVKSFLKIAKANDWIILSATPGDTWEQYIPVFLANGFYRNKSQFINEHVRYDPRCRKYPKIIGYYNTGRLIRLRNKILIDMDFSRKTIPHHEDIYAGYDITVYKDAMKNRWDPYKNAPIEQASGLCYVLRRIVNSDESRQVALIQIYEKHPKMIVFYNFDYELDILKGLYYGENVEIAEWNGHKHQEIPKSDNWVYLVQYTAGCEGWNSIRTDTIVFYSQNYSYKVMQQASGRIDRLNTPYIDLYYYHIKSRSGIDIAIGKALSAKKKFNETRWVNW